MSDINKAFLFLKVCQKELAPAISLTDFFVDVIKRPTWVGEYSAIPLLEIADDFSENHNEPLYTISFSWDIVEREVADFLLFVPSFARRIKHELPLFFELRGCMQLVGDMKEIDLASL